MGSYGCSKSLSVTQSVILYITICLWAIIINCSQLVDGSESFQILVNQGRNEPIRLKSFNQIRPGTMVSLPVEIDESKISLDGKRPPRLRAITSENETVAYFGIGDEVHVNLEFYSEVYVTGQPSITMNTGCRTIQCMQPEIQSFYCAADDGMFSMRLEDQFIMNLHVNTTAIQLKKKLEELRGIDEVSVEISSDNSDPVMRNRLCSNTGNNITLTFNRTTFPQYHGNVPTIHLNAINDDANLVSGFAQGVESFLKRNSQADKVRLPNVTTEVVAGRNQSDGLAYYGYGNETSKITFIYTVKKGDTVDSLDVISINFGYKGYITSRYGQNVSTEVPIFGIGRRYLTSSPSSLSYVQPIVVSSAIPKVISLNSPNVSAVYTAGDVLYVDVIFDLAFSVRNPELFGLELASGIFTRQVPFNSTLSDPPGLRFVYAVQQNDASTALDVTGINALYLNGGKIFLGSINSATGEVSEVDAIIVLPEPGYSDSLSVNKQIVINTVSPVVISVTTIPAAGNYTAGDLLRFDVLFNTRITVSGAPRFPLINIPRTLNVNVRTAPHLPSFSYVRSYPGGITQIIMKVQFNWDLYKDDKIQLYLPHLHARETDYDKINSPNERVSPITVHGDSSFTGYWNETAKVLNLVVGTEKIQGYAITELLIESQTGLFISEDGLVPTSSGMSERLSLDSAGISSAYTQGFPFQNVECVGFKNLSLVIEPLSFIRLPYILFNFEVPEYLVAEDEISLYLPDFYNSSLDTTVSTFTASDGSQFAFQWRGNSSQLVFSMISSIASTKSFSFNLSSLLQEINIPNMGVSKQNVKVSLDSNKNGQLANIDVPYITNICSAPIDGSISITYEYPHPGSISAATFYWNTGLFPLSVGDKVYFTLPHISNLYSGVLSYLLIREQFAKDHFEISVVDNEVRFKVTQYIPAGTEISVTLENQVGITVPSSGVLSSRGDYFYFLVKSQHCGMAAERKITYSKDSQVVRVINPMIKLSPDNSSFGALTAMDVVFTLVDHGLSKGDEVIVTLKKFPKAYSGSLDENNLILSNANVSTRYSNNMDKFIFLLLEDFELNSGESYKTLYFNVSRNALVSVPDNGVSSNDVALSIKSNNFGLLTDESVSISCMGFCSGSIEYSTFVTDSDMTVAVTVTYSSSIPLGSILTFYGTGMTVPDTSNFALSVSIGGDVIDSSKYTYSLFNTNNVNITLSGTSVASGSSIVFSFSGFQLSTDSSASYPKISFVDERYYGNARFEFDPPSTVYEYPSMDSSVFEFDTTTQTSFTWTFDLASGVVIPDNSVLLMKLPGFSSLSKLESAFKKNSMLGYLEDSAGVLDQTKSFYNQTAELMKFYVNRTIFDDEQVTITVRGINPPVYGIQPDSTSILYGVAFGSAAESITSWLTFSSVTKYITIFNTSLEFDFYPNSIKHLKALTISIDVTNGFSAGDIIVMPNLDSIQVKGANEGLNVSLICSYISSGSCDEVINGTWWGVENTLLLTVLSSTTGTLELTFNVTTDGFYLADTGIKGETPFDIIVYDSDFNYVANHTEMLPCVGVCSINLKPTAATPNRATAYNLDMQWRGFGMLPGDFVSFYLLDFSGASAITMKRKNISCTNIFDEDIGFFQFHWYANSANSSVLKIFYPHQRNYSSEVFTLKCHIPQDMNIILPTDGIRSGETYISNMTYHLDGFNDYFASDAVAFPNVGSAVLSTVIIEPAISNKPVALEFILSFQDDLQEGDVINIYLPNFVAPTRPLPFTSIKWDDDDTTVSIIVSSMSAVTKERRNIDSSLFYDRMISYLTVTLQDALPAGKVLAFSLENTVGIISPIEGVYTRPLPWFSIVSDTSPIAGSTFANVTRFGTLNPSKYVLSSVDEKSITKKIRTSTNESLSYLLLDLEFTASCPIFQNDSILIKVPQISPMNLTDNDLDLISVTLKSWNTSSTMSLAVSSFNVSYLSPNGSMLITMDQGYVLSGKITFQILFAGFEFTTDIVYENDLRITYDLYSDTCPVNNGIFSSTSYHLVKSSNMKILPVDSLNGNNVISMNVVPMVSLRSGDMLVLYLENITYNSTSSGRCSFDEVCQIPLLTSSPSGAIPRFLSLNVSMTSVMMILTIQEDIAASTQIYIATSSNSTDGFIFVNDATNPMITAHVAMVSGDSSEIEFSGPILNIETIPFLTAVNVDIANPIAGTNSSLTISWTMSSELSSTNKMEFVFPGFSLYPNANPTWSYSSEDAVQQFYITFSPENSTLSLVPKIPIPGRTSITVTIPAIQGVVNSLEGLPFRGQGVSVYLWNGGKKIFHQNVDSFTVVPYMATSSLKFLSSDAADAFVYGGNLHALQLEPGHELSEGDGGEMIIIDGDLYNIDKYEDNVLYLVEEYRGQRVFLGSPEITVASTSYRYATYLSGSGTDHLIFQYKVARGDLGYGLRLYSQSGSSKYVIELNGGSLLRASQSPIVAASLSLPSILSGDHRFVDTYTPTIEEIYTTSAAGAYGEGEYVDIIVKFTEDVVIYPPKEQAQPPPRILLNLHSSGIQYAEYYNGSGTTDIVFLYKVRSYDNEVNITSDMIKEKQADRNDTEYDLPFLQPLRFIVGSHFGYLRRRSDIPLLDADLDLTNATFSFESNPQFIGAAPIVTKLELFRNPHKVPYGGKLETYMASKTYSAGDYIEFSVTYSKPVEVKIPEDNSTRPYIELDVGRNVPGVAYYERPLGRSTLLFRYLVTIEDQLPHGLLLFCTCEDYLRRSFIHLNGSVIVGRDEGLTASLLIADGPHLSSLQIDESVEVINDVPRVMSVTSNVTTGVYAPGDSILVNVHYSAPVYVLGIVTLHLQGQVSSCRAPFYDGNGTDSLNFVYHVSSYSGVSKLDCSSASGLDTTLGTIYRNTEVPTIIANNSLPLPGSQIALGRQENIIVDTNNGHVDDITLDMHFPDTMDISNINHVNFLPTQSVSFNYLTDTSLDELYSLCGCDVWVQNGSFSSTTLEDMAVTHSNLLSIMNVTSLIELPDYERFVLVGRYLDSIDSVPVEVSRCLNWWKSYHLEKQIDFLIDFNRPVVQEGVYVKVNTGSSINRARSIASHKHYQLMVAQPQSNIVYDENGDEYDWGSFDHYFALRYNGQISPCIALTINVKGEDSFLDALLAITQLQPFLPSVSKTFVTPTVVQLDIDFIKALDYPLELLYGQDVSTICQYPASGESVMLVDQNSKMVLRYDIQHEDALVVTSKDTIPAGSYSMNLKGPKLGLYQEVLADSFKVKHLSSGQVIRGYSTATNNPIARITRSSLIFSSNYPGNFSQIHVEVCVSSSFEVGDAITIHLPNFNERTSSMNTPSTSEYSAEWDSDNSELIFTVLSSISCLKTPSGSNAYNITLPSRAIYRNDRSYSFSTNSSTAGTLNNVHFQFVKPVGIADISLALSDPRPYVSTKLFVHIELLMDLQPGNETMELYLPGFYSIDSLRADINIEGFFGEHINGRWWNQSSTMYFTPYRRIPAGVYDFVVESDVFALLSPPAGIDSTNPPGVSIKDPYWRLDVTPMVNYPIIYGYDTVYAEISVNSSYVLSSLFVEILVSRTIKGPAMFAITIPSLSHKYGYYSSYNQSFYDEAIWYDFNKTWVIKRNSGWKYTGSPLSFTLSNVTDFYVNERGINTHFGPDNETTIALIATDGILPPIPFNFAVGVPIITNASVELVNLQKDIFYTGKETIVLDFDVNRPPQFEDSFYLKIEGGLHLNFSQAKSDDFCFDIKGYMFTSNHTILEIGMSNASWILCKYHLMYHLHISISNVAVIQSSKLIRQYDFPYVSVAWTNNEMTTDYRYVTRSPWLGLYMSSLTFSNPYGGQSTGMELKLSTATKLQKGDIINLMLQDVACNFTTSSATQYATVNDIHGVAWSWKCVTTQVGPNIADTVISMVVPINLPASAIHFDLLDRNVLLLPAYSGISPYGHVDQVKVGLQRKDKVVHSQHVSLVTPVGYINYLNVHILRESHKCQLVECEYEGMLVTKYGMELAISTLARLSSGNTINITFDSVTFQYPKVLPISGKQNGLLEVRAVSSHVISVIIFERSYDEELEISILPSTYIDVNLNGAFSAVFSVDIDSFASPIQAHEVEFGLLMLEDPVINLIQSVNVSQSYIVDAGFNTDNVMEIEIFFKMRQSFTVGDEIHLYLPRFLNRTDSLMVPSAFAIKNDSSVDWNIKMGQNDSLVLVATQNISSSSQSTGEVFTLTIATDRLNLVDGLIYDKSMIAFKVIDFETNHTMDTSFFSVVPLGLAEASISFRYPVVNTVSAIDIHVVAANVFNASEYLLIYLPGFTNTLGSSMNATVTPSSCSLEWDSESETLYIEMKSSTESVTISLFEFQLPIFGVNNFNGTIPKISYNQTLTTNSWFGPASFSSIEYVSPSISVNMTFGSNTAGDWSSIDVVFSSSMIVFNQNDRISIFLPQFYSNHEAVEVTSTFGSFLGQWIACEETLVVIAAESFTSPIERVEWGISSLVLPPKGVTDALATVIAIESNSMIVGKQIFTIDGVERIGYVDDSKIWFSPAVINSTSPDLIVDFLFSLPIVEGDVITLTLPGIITSDTCTLVSNLTIPFDIDADIGEQTITLTSRYHWSPMRWVSLNISDCVIIPNEGFPMVKYSDHSYFIAADLEAGYIGTTEIKQIAAVGINQAHVHYVIPDTSQPIGLQFTLEFTSELVEGDEIAIYLPYANSTRDLNNLTLHGDLASEGYRSHFEGRFDQETSTIFFKCVKEMPLREFTIYVGANVEEPMTLSLVQDRNASHHLSGNFSMMGSLIQRWIPYSPTNIGLVRNPEVSLTTCNGTLFCEFELKFTLADDLEAGNHIVFSHEQLRLPAFTALNFTDGSSSDVSNKFDLFWRSADHQEAVAIEYHELYLEPELNGRLWVASDMQTLEVDKSLAVLVAASNFKDVSIITRIPRVKSLVVTSPYDHYFCGEEIDIVLTMDSAVHIIDPTKVKLLLNTGEYAVMYQQLDANRLLFRYAIKSPRQTSLESLAAAGPAALELLSFDQIVYANNAHVVANLTLDSPFELRKPSFTTGYFETISITCDNTAVVDRIYAYSGEQMWYSNGDVLDVNVVFNRPVYVLGKPQLILSELSSQTNLVAEYVDVSRIQQLHVVFTKTENQFRLVYRGETSSCLSANDTTGIAEALKSLNSLQESLPLHIEKLANVINEYQYELTFFGVSPELLMVDSTFCEDRTSAHVLKDPKLVNEVTFRYTVESTDPTGNISQANSSALHFVDYSKIMVRDTFIKKQVDPTLPDSTDDNSLHGSSNIWINNQSPYVLNVTSNFNELYGRVARNGDNITIEVVMSAPMVSKGSVLLPLAMENVMNTSQATVYASLMYIQDHVLVFSYYVNLGDFTELLDVAFTPNSMVVVDGELGGYLRRLSRVPWINSSLELPFPGAANGLSLSNVAVNATMLPVIMRAYVTPVNWKATAGSTVIINVEFSSNVSLTSTSLDLKPRVDLMSPSGASMYYSSGSGSTTLQFSYYIKPEHATGNVSFVFMLEHGYLTDLMGHNFANLTDQLITVEFFGVDTHIPTVVKVDCNCEDGIYYPGQVLDIFILFDKEVYILNSTKALNPIELELFVYKQADQLLLAQYAYGNGTRSLHFMYTIPEPDKFTVSESPQRIDYAGTAALEKHLKYAYLTDVSPIPTTRADVFLPILDVSYLAYKRRVLIDFHNAKVDRVYALRNGTYTVGDKLTIVVHFTTPVMFFSPAPYLMLAMGTTSKSDKIATYVKGNYSRSLFFEYVIEPGDSTKRLDYIDSRNLPYDTSSVTRSFPLISYDNYEAKFYDSAIAGLYMSSEVSRIPIECSFPLPGSKGSLSVSSSVKVDTTRPVVLSVQAMIPSGTYGSLSSIPLLVEFNEPVVVQGCPYLIFIVNRVKRIATYVSGSGGRILYFNFTILPDEYSFTFDYWDRHSLRIQTCNETDSMVFINRLSDNPTLAADLTLPAPGASANSVDIATSIVSSGKNITISGGSIRPIQINTGLMANQSYSFGDIIDITAHFTGEFNVTDPLIILELLDLPSDERFGNAYAVNQTTKSEVRFEYLIGPYENNEHLSYNGSHAMYAASKTSCLFVDLVTRRCMQQSLPDIGQLDALGQDYLTNKHIRVVPMTNMVTIQKIAFIPAAFARASGDAFDNNPLEYLQPTYLTGDRVVVEIEFSDPVVVTGEPVIFLQLNDTAKHLKAQYYRQPTPSSILFTYMISRHSYHGKLACGKGCMIYFEQGAIRKRNNFLSITHADIAIPEKRHCLDEACDTISTQIVEMIPHVIRVYSNSTGVVANGETISIFVEFSCAIRHEGGVFLILDLFNDPMAHMVGYLEQNTVIHFHHTVTDTDYTSALDYKNISSLIVLPSLNPSIAANENPGIYFITKEITIPADLTLPLRGSEESLGRQSPVIIDQTRPNIVKVYSIPDAYTTCGDQMRIVVEYSQPMKMVQYNPRYPLKNNTLSLFLKPSNNSLAIRYFNASLVEVDEAKVIFEYYISAKVPIGSISLFSRAPLQLNGWKLVSKMNGITGPDIWDDSFLTEINLPVVKGTPVVKRVYSYNSSTTETYSAGDVLFIFVEMSTGVRVKDNKATLELFISGKIQQASYAGMADNNKAIVFSYEVQGGDATDSLEYNGEYAFHGEVYQISSCEVPVPALMTLPPAHSQYSLATCCRLILASEVVYIESLVPIKGAGSYGTNEEILIVARFTDKVVVNGEPYLLLDVGNGRIGRANYTSLEELHASSDYDDLSIAFSAKDVVFKYIVQETDQIDSLIHAGVDAFQIPEGSSILQYSNNPIFYVDPTLRDPKDFSIVNGKVERQWKYRFPQKVEVLLRDMYHNNANSLTFTVEHRGKTGTIFSSKKDHHLGVMSKDGLFAATTGSGTKGNNYLEGSDDSLFYNNPFYTPPPQGKGGTSVQDIFFSDSNLVNIANKGLANQSSTVNEASCAIDGQYSPLIGDGFISQTIREKTPWWTLTMPTNEDVVIQTIRIYERKPEQWITPMIDLVIKGLDRYPTGHFQLNFTFIDPKNDSIYAVTDFIPFRASADEMKAAISATFAVGNVDIVKTQLTLCENGCGNGVDQGLGDIYQLTFTSIYVAEPVVSVTNIKYPGEKLYEETSPAAEIQRFPIVWYSRTSRTGRYVTIAKEYMGSEVDYSGTNEWLTPFYVMIFSKESKRTPNDTTTTIPTGLNESLAKAFFYYRVESIDTVVNIQLPRPIHDVYGIKIQREGYGILCLTEVEVYTEALNLFSTYQHGSPVQSMELMNPYTPELPFNALFNHLPYDGRWFFELSQDKPQDSESEASFGQVSEVVVLITDMAGIVHAYYQDIFSLVTTLPRYGRLFSTTSGSYVSYPSSWQDTFGLVVANQIKPKIDEMRPMGQCMGEVTDGECEWQSDDGVMSSTPEIASIRLQGDIPNSYLPLRNERVLYYVPDAYFTGYDYFTYQAYDRITVSSEVTVNLLVQPCRQFFRYSSSSTTVTTTSSSSLSASSNELESNIEKKRDDGFFNQTSSRLLCDCMPSASSILGDDIEKCEISRAKLCSQSSLRPHYISMCSACYASTLSVYDSVTDTVMSHMINEELVESTSCRSETIRAVSLLRLRGICVNVAELTDHGDSQTLSVTSRAISDESVVCLKTQHAITPSNTLRKNFIPYQATLFTKKKR